MLDIKKMLTKITKTPLVIESASVGEVTYRKWSDGTLEQWGVGHFSAVSGNATMVVTLPVAFTNNSYSVALGRGRNMNNYVTQLSLCDAAGNTGRSKNSFTITAYKSGFNYTLDFDFYAIGKWK